MKPLLVLLLVGLILSACQPASNPAVAPNRNDSQSGYDFIFETPTDPLAVTPTPDTARQVQAIIPLQGGSLNATGADGTRYTLEIPPDALTSETLIRMTPLASLSGLPFGSGEVLAVQLQPEGAFFNNFLTLTITPPQPIPVDQQILYGFHGSGNQLSLATPVVQSSEIKILIQHFSGYGVTKGLLADVEPYRQRLGGDAETRLQSEIAYQLGRARQQQLLGSGETTDDLQSILPDLFARFDREVVQPRIAAAGESCAAGRLALQTVLGFERQKQLLGLSSEDNMSRVNDVFQTAGMVCVKEEYELCANDHIIHRMIPVWLGFERQAQLLGAGEGESPLTQEARRLTEQCLRFDLEFYSSATFDAGEGDGFDSVARSKVPIRFSTADMQFTGQAPLVNESFEFRVKGCRVDSRRGGSTFHLNNFKYIADTRSPNDALGYVRDIELTYFPERTTETFTVTCPDSPSYSTPPSGLWWGVFLITHFSEVGGLSGGISAPPAELLEGLGFGAGMMDLPINPEEGLLASDWEILGGEYFAKKEWTKENTEAGIIEVGTFKLYHRPGR
jgi:hypothetical protein